MYLQKNTLQVCKTYSEPPMSDYKKLNAQVHKGLAIFYKKFRRTEHRTQRAIIQWYFSER